MPINNNFKVPNLSHSWEMSQQDKDLINKAYEEQRKFLERIELQNKKK